MYFCNAFTASGEFSNLLTNSLNFNPKSVCFSGSILGGVPSIVITLIKEALTFTPLHL